VGGWCFSKNQNLIVDIAENAPLESLFITDV
jgi:hypothetical protein